MIAGMAKIELFILILFLYFTIFFLNPLYYFLFYYYFCINFSWICYISQIKIKSTYSINFDVEYITQISHRLVNWCQYTWHALTTLY